MIEKHVTSEILDFASQQKWLLIRVEAKAQLSSATGQFTVQPTPSGTPDLVGCDNAGWSLFIEVKTPQRKNKVSQDQRDFLFRAIHRGAFALVAYSVPQLKSVYAECKHLSDQERKLYLLSLLPKAKISKPATKKPIEF